MGGAVRPGGCERCGASEGVSYSGWQYLCRECRSELERKRLQEIKKHQMLHQLEEAERVKQTGGS